MGAVDDYRRTHRPIRPDDEYGAWLFDLAAMMPADVYTHPEWYTGFPQWLPEVTRAMHRARGDGAALVRVYRAVPGGVSVIHTGDWVTLSSDYARQHAESNGDAGWRVVSAVVRADAVSCDGDDLMECGYWGPTLDGL